MFKKIVEEALNEINANDAYEKFYSSLDRDFFNKLIEVYGGKFDNIIKALLKDVIERHGDFGRAFNFVKKYKSVPNEVRIKFLQHFKAGEYDGVLDMFNGLVELESNGVETLKSMQSSGLIVLCDNDTFKITCTTTYSANHHFFGNTRWCTASDRLGRYDGWVYFLSYIFDMDTDEIEDHHTYNELRPSWVSNCLVQCYDKRYDETYQLQINHMGNINIICNSNDEEVYESELPELEPAFQLIKDNVTDLIKATRISFEKEFEYQKQKDYYIEQKRVELDRKRTQLAARLEIQATENTKQKFEIINKKFKELLDSNLLENPEFIEQIITFYHSIPDDINQEEHDEYHAQTISTLEEGLKRNYYASICDMFMSVNNICAVSISPICGLLEEASYDNDSNPILDNDFFQYRDNYGFKLKGMAVVFIKTDGAYHVESVLKVEKNYDSEPDGEYDMEVFSLVNGYDYSGQNKDEKRRELHKYIGIRQGVPSEEGVSITEIQLFDIEKNRTLKILDKVSRPNNYWNYSFISEKYLLIGERTDHRTTRSKVIDRKTFQVVDEIESEYFDNVNHMIGVLKSKGVVVFLGDDIFETNVRIKIEHLGFQNFSNSHVCVFWDELLNEQIGHVFDYKLNLFLYSNLEMRIISKRYPQEIVLWTKNGSKIYYEN